MPTSKPSNLILSVVIPTTGERIDWLQRAVESALFGWQPNSIEILIVLNKNLEKLDTLNYIFANNSDIKILISSPSGASRARNLGLQKAKGDLVRFLDDDDYLYPKIAIKQCKELLISNADISSYAIDLINEDGQQTKTRYPIEENDCIIALSQPARLQIPLSFAYKTSVAQKCTWQENLNLAEDTVWLLNLLSTQNISWIRSNSVVGVWFQHNRSRLSRPRPTHMASIAVADALIKLSNSLSNSHPERNQAIAAGLWNCFIGGFKFNPTKWSQVGKQIILLDKASTPSSRIYKACYQMGLSPIASSWLFLPGFWLLLLIRFLFDKK